MKQLLVSLACFFCVSVSAANDYIRVTGEAATIEQAKENAFREAVQIRAGTIVLSGRESNLTSLVKDNMFRIEKQYYMSVQPAIWKRESLLDIATNFKEHQYRCSECSEIQSYVCNKYISFCSLTVNDIKVEHQKTVSKIYPVYHVITYGRWILEDEYSMKVIKNISSEFNINLLKLGVRVGDNSYTMTVEQFLSNPIMVSKYNKFLEM